MLLDLKLADYNKPDTLRLSLDGHLDSDGAAAFDKAVAGMLTHDFKILILDLEKLSFISSAGLRALAKSQKLMRQREGRLTIVNTQPQVRKVFVMVKAVCISNVFDSYTDLDEYLEFVQREC